MLVAKNHSRLRYAFKISYLKGLMLTKLYLAFLLQVESIPFPYHFLFD